MQRLGSMAYVAQVLEYLSGGTAKSCDLYCKISAVVPRELCVLQYLHPYCRICAFLVLKYLPRAVAVDPKRNASR